MAKCGGCGKFMSTTAECIRCTSCPGAYHYSCVGIATTAKVSPKWLCPGCKAKVPRTDNSLTPVKGLSDGIETCASHQPQTNEAKENAHVIKSPVLDVAYEIRCFREELGAMRTELRQFRQDMSELKDDVSSCKDRMNITEKKLSDLEKRFEEKEPASYDKLEGTIAELKLQLNERDQEMLLNDIIITGIPETKEESPIHIVNLVALKLGVTIDERDVVYTERIGMVRRNFIATSSVSAAEPLRPRALAVRLSRRAARDQLLKAARVRRGLTTSDLELHGPSQKFYLNERLTPTNGKLFYNAREAGQRLKYKYVWTKDGRIYAKKEDGVPAQRVRSDIDLIKNFGNGPV